MKNIRKYKNEMVGQVEREESICNKDYKKIEKYAKCVIKDGRVGKIAM